MAMTEKERRAGYLRELEGNERHPLHGTRAGYSYGCRCERCKAAIRAYELERKARRQREATKPTGFMYAFPAHKATRDAVPSRAYIARQVRKVCAEADELAAAVIFNEPDWRVLEELMDTYHACETLMRAWSAEEVFEMRNAVVAKNDARGYYGEGE